MQVDVSRVDDATTRLNVSLTAAEVNSVIDATYQRIGQRMKIPGFRPGKAPRPLLLRTYGEEDFYHSATDEAIRKFYPMALRNSAVQALDSGQLDDDDDHLKPDEEFKFSALVPTVPEIELPDLGEIKIPAPSTLVTQEDVEKVLNEVRESRATLEPAPAKAAAIGDVVKMKLQARVAGDEVADRDEYDFELVDAEKEARTPFPGLSKELTGARPGDIREINLPLPEDYEDPNYAGKTMILNIVVKEVQRKVLPDLTDEWVAEVSNSAKTVDGLRDLIRHNLEHERNEAAMEKVAEEVIDSLIARVNPPSPTVLVEEELDRRLRQHRRVIGQAGMTFEQYLIAASMSEEEYREQQRPAAERAVKRDLLLDAVIDAEGIQPDPTDVDAQVRNLSASIGRSPRDVDRFAESPRLHSAVAMDIGRQAALTRLIETVSGLKPIVHDHEREQPGNEHDHEHSESADAEGSPEHETDELVAGS